MQVTGNHQVARIVRHNDESVRDGYIRNGGKELEVSEELGITQSVISRLWQRFQDDSNVSRCYRTGHPRVTMPNEDRYIWQLLPKETDGAQHQTCLVSSATGTTVSRHTMCRRLGFSLQSDSRWTLLWRAPGTRYHQENTIERHRYGGAGWLVWGGIILGSRTDLHVHNVTMTGHVYWNVILEQHVRLFWGAMVAEFLFMDDNARPHHANIVDECFQSEDITRMDWPACSPYFNPKEIVFREVLDSHFGIRAPYMNEWLSLDLRQEKKYETKHMVANLVNYLENWHVCNSA
ncbi:transposable element Tcb1 transposase [Trichonephila clavipes]|uniref:Transposable element Tcb1 transposase n=1 Tax=Trichonephila clavipes TaxID=2585209 RepID=A0A8X6W275_TRICX|nr:transposable element Tcb1 transposase [Trichonephila clavipes]